MYSPSGQLVRTYGPEIGTFGSLSYPFGVSIDRAGRIVVCDNDNCRVLHVWSDQDGDHWESLFNEDQLDECPFYVDIDNDNRLMAVSMECSIKLYTF